MEGYKVVRKNMTSSYASICKELQIKYKLGINKPKVKGSVIYFYKTIEAAKIYTEFKVRKDLRLFRCQAVNAEPTKAVGQVGFILDGFYNEVTYVRLLEAIRNVGSPVNVPLVKPSPETYQTEELELLGEVK